MLKLSEVAEGRDSWKRLMAGTRGRGRGLRLDLQPADADTHNRGREVEDISKGHLKHSMCLQ